LLYLLAYNLLFILPLVLVFIAVYSGLRSETLLRWSSRNVVFSKTLLGVFFIGLALFFLFL
jgi:cytochrome c biogenesis protein CcdA